MAGELKAEGRLGHMNVYANAVGKQCLYLEDIALVVNCNIPVSITETAIKMIVSG